MHLNVIRHPPEHSSSEVFVEVFDDNMFDINRLALEIDHSAMLESFLSNFPMKPSGILPPGIRYVSPDQQFIVFERPPSYAEIIYTHESMASLEQGGKGMQKHSFTIPLPWLTYAALLSPSNDPLLIWVFATRSQLKDDLDPWSIFPLPNFYPDGHLCMAPQTTFNSVPSLHSAVNTIFESVWASHFNADLFHYFQNNIVPFFSLLDVSFHDWKRNQKPNSHLGVSSSPKEVTAIDIFSYWSSLNLMDMLHINYIYPEYPNLRSMIDSHQRGILGKSLLDDVDMNKFFVSRLLASIQNCRVV